MRNWNKRAFIISIICAVLFAVCFQFGYAIKKTGELMITSPLWWGMFIVIGLPATVFVYSALCGKICSAFGLLANKKDGSSETESGNGLTVSVKNVLINQLIIFVCWLPVFLAEYPGFFVYDATDEYIEVATRTFTTHHPLAHVLALGGFVCGGNKIFGNYNAGIAMYTLAQMLFVSLVFGWIASIIRPDGKKDKKIPGGYIAVMVWYCLFPTVVMFALCSAKDTLFAAFMVIAVVLSQRLLTEIRRSGAIKINTDCIFWAISLVLMMLMRNNGFYAVLVYSVLFILFTAGAVRGKKYYKSVGEVIFLFVLVFAIYKTTDLGLIKLTHASDTESQELLTVPIQQLARTWNVYKNEMDETDEEALFEIIPEDALLRYTPDLSDPVKVDFDNAAFGTNKTKYIKLWFKLLKEHPVSYLNAWLNTSYGFYYPNTVVNVYAGHEVNTFTYTESSYFGYEVEYPGERVSLIPLIDRFYRWLSLDSTIQTIPVLSLLFSMGALIWIYIFAAGKFIYEKRYSELVSLSLPGAVWLTLLLGPTFLPRYTVFLWFLLPYVIYSLIQEKK